MKRLVRNLLVRNFLEVCVLIALLFIFFKNKNISNLSIIPLAFVLPVFFYDFYKIYNFSKREDYNGLLKFESRLLFFTFAWYFFPAFLSVVLIFRNLQAMNLINSVAVGLLYTGLYYLNYKTSRSFKEDSIGA